MTTSYSHKLDHSSTLQGEHFILELNGLYANIPLLASYSGARTKTYYVITVGREKKTDKKIH